LINSLDVDVLGTGKRSGDSVPMMNTGIDGIGGDAKNSPELSNPDRSSFDHGFEDYDPKKVGNYLNIDVSGISVSAINTMEGGNAVATSNIIIKPVQIIYCTPEVEEKLR
jgi:hypothetical protein